MGKADKYIADKHINTEYKPLYHLSAPYGWCNDPNGFCYYNGEWHLFYQYNPYSSRWGRMHWGHAKSKNLCDWQDLPVALSPDYRNNDGFLGCFSGSAIEKNGELYLMYTGVPFFKQHQLLAKSNDGITFSKFIKPVIPIRNRPPGAGRFNFRDPKIIAIGDNYYCVVGASRGKGRQIALYNSKDLVVWNYRGSIKTEERSKGIFECPDLVHTANGDILIYSVMHTKTRGMDYQNLHSSVYELGNADFENASFLPYCEAEELDKGCDFYAPQTATSPDGRVIMVAWMQMWMRSIPTAYLGHGFSGMFTLPRELEVRNNKLYQKPIREVYSLFEEGNKAECDIKEETEIEGFSGNTFLLKLRIRYCDKLSLKLRKGKDCCTLIIFDNGIITFNREQSGHPIKGMDGNCNIRQMHIDSQEFVNAEIFSDKSSIEIFINDRHCMSNTVYPFKDGEGITFESDCVTPIKAIFCPYKK